MKKLEDFAKLLSGDVALAGKCVEAKFDVETMKKLAKEKGFDFTTEELAPFASSLSVVMDKAKELKLTDDALAGVAGGQKEGYDKPSSVGKDDGAQLFPVAIVAVIAAASAAVVVAKVAVESVTGVANALSRK